MNIFKKRSRKGFLKGFTLVELLVVISIIIIFMAIILAAIVTARQNTREKRRMADMAQIELALTLYKEKNKDFPVAANAIEIGHGGILDAEIKKFVGTVPVDPSSDAVANGQYSYWYDADFYCQGKRMKVIYAKTVEQSKNGNYTEVCGATLPYNTFDTKQFAFVDSTVQTLTSLLTKFIPRAEAGGKGGGGGPTPPTAAECSAEWVLYYAGTSTHTLAELTANCAPPPVTNCGTFTIVPNIFKYGGGDSTLTWTSTNAQSASISPAVGSVGVNGSKAVFNTKTTMYTFTAVGLGTSCTKTASVVVDTDPHPGLTTSGMYVQILKE